MTADILHIGHIRALAEAKTKCKYLVVGLLTDEAVESYKSVSPLIPFEERRAILESIRYIDRVIPQFSIDMTDNLEILEPEFVFSADGWESEEMRAIDKTKCQSISLLYFVGETANSTRIKEKICQKQQS